MRCLLAAVCLCMIGSMVSADEPAASPSAGYTMSLFDGRSLDGWKVANCDVGVENGAIVLREGNGWVRSDLRYADFVLELDWKAEKSEAYDSGIYLRADLPKGKANWPSRYQVNLKQGEEGNINPKVLAGATSKGLIKPGEWNHFKLTVIGHAAALEINGKPAWKVDGIEPAAGYIGFQSEVPLGGRFEFRDIKITELGYASLFDGKTLDGWEGATGDASQCWSVKDGAIFCSGQRGPWMRSKEQYGDFNLRFEYQLQPGGNSGVYIRVPREGAHRGRDFGSTDPSGVEIQLLDDAHKRHANIKPSQYAGSIYNVVASRERVARPAGEWNCMEIDCRGKSYRVTHNGAVVIDASDKEYPDLGLREVRGYLGLQDHRSPVAFRHLRIGPPLP